MPENPQDEATRQGDLLRDLTHRFRDVEEMLRHLCQLFAFGSSMEFRTGEGRTVVYNYFPTLNPSWRDYFLKLQPGQEYAVGQWRHLVGRHHPWRRQLYVKGRNMTVRQLVGTVKANKLSAEEAADDLDLPVEAIHEALHYAEKYKDLIESDSAYERHLSSLWDREHGARPLP